MALSAEVRWTWRSFNEQLLELSIKRDLYGVMCNLGSQYILGRGCFVKETLYSLRTLECSEIILSLLMSELM